MDSSYYLTHPKEFEDVCKQIFAKFDKNKNGVVDIKELGEAMKEFASASGVSEPDNLVIQETMKSFDANKSQTLDFKEFQLFVKKILLA